MTPVGQISPRQRAFRVLFFFPFQLVWVHLKRNHILLVFWIILFSLVSRSIATKFGLPILFLYPEYLGEVGFPSHLILGLSCGGFVMSYNIASYIINGFRFPFLATLSTPFFKYSVNNFILPFSFLGVYLYNIYDFQVNSELLPPLQVLLHLLGFLLGNTVFILICFGYFTSLNKNAEDLLGKIPRKKMKGPKTFDNPVTGGFHRKEKWYRKLFSREWRVDTYLAHPFRINLARKSEHYTKDMLRQVFQHNHINATFFEVGVIFLVLLFGFFRETPAFAIPAAASIFLLLTMVLMIFSAIHSWLKGWSTLVFIVLAIALNTLSQYPSLGYYNFAYGLDYQSGTVEYSLERIRELGSDRLQQQADRERGLQILENWKARNPGAATFTNHKPKLLILSTSGGGLRSAMWTYVALQHADSLLQGEVMQHMNLMTGSSGGLIGAAFLREVAYRDLQSDSVSLYDNSYADQMGTDILNPTALTLAIHDLFFRLQKAEDLDNRYTKDRGYAFELQLNKNTNFWLDKRLEDYREPEYRAEIPLMILAPAVNNDGRRLIVASQPVSYLTALPTEQADHFVPASESVEYQRLFEGLHPEKTKFTTALRMSATFPYVMPNVNLPTTPATELMDAGARDNLGMLAILQYLYTFREWIETNTSGVVILQVRDTPKETEQIVSSGRSLAQTMVNPLGNLYKNWLTIQDYQQDRMIEMVPAWLDTPFDMVYLKLDHSPEEAISLSWHLTKKEKEKICKSVDSPNNQAEIQRLRRLLE